MPVVVIVVVPVVATRTVDVGLVLVVICHTEHPFYHGAAPRPSLAAEDLGNVERAHVSAPDGADAHFTPVPQNVVPV